MYLFSNCITCELIQIGTELAIGFVGVNGDKTLDVLVKERGCDFLDSIIINFVLIAIRENLGLVLLGKCVIDAVPHLLVFMCSALLISDACFLTNSLKVALRVWWLI